MRAYAPLVLLLSALGVTLASVACTAPAADDAASSSEDHLASQARKGAEFVRCWTVSDGNADEFFRRYALTCHVTSAGLPGPGGAVYVDADGTANGHHVSGTPSDKLDQDVVIGAVSKSDFPLSLRVYGEWATAPSTMLSYFRTVVPATENANASAPVVVKMPFDTWPVTFLNRLSLAVVDSNPYSVNAAPFITAQDDSSTATTFSTSLSTGVSRDPRIDTTVIAPAGGSLHVDVQGAGAHYDATLTGPGVYVIEAFGLRFATAAEEAAAGPSAADGGAGSTPSSPTSDSSAPSAPTTTCGGPGQMHCTSPNGNWSCLDGTRGDSASGICLPCGDANETYCFVDPNNVQGNYRCNAGTRYDSATDLCIACGAVGQTHCFDDPNNVQGNATCNPGLHYDSNGNCAM